MTHFSILLLGIYAMNALLFTSFTPLSNGAKAGKLYTFPTTQIFAPALGVATWPDKTSTDFSEEQQPVADTTIYLPIVMNNFHTYSGTITDNGVPVPGDVVDLRFFDGSVWSTYDTQVTDPSGSFFFTDLPELISGQEYYVRWFNNLANTNYLSAYYCDTIDLDNIDSGLLACDFNIHNVFHVSPDNAASVRLPKNFEWTLRPTITDNYELDISDTIDDDPWWWTDPLGYTNTYRLTSLPTGFQTNLEYGWFIGVYGINGMGFSYYYRTITFENTGNMIIGPEVPIDHLRMSQRKEQELIPPVKE